MLHKKINTILVATILVAFLTTNLFAQNGTRMIGFNAKTVGRAGTGIGIFDNPDLMMTNPAGLSFLKSSMLDVSFSLMAPSLHFDNAINNKEGESNYYPLPGLSYVNHSTDNPLTWGIGIFTQGGMGSEFILNHDLFRVNNLDPIQQQNTDFVTQEYYSKFAVMQGGPSFSYKLSPSFSVGVSLHLVYSEMEFRMPYSLSPSVLNGVVNPQTGMTFGDMFSASPQHGGFGYDEVTAYADMSDLSTFSFGGKIGVAYKMNDLFSFGLSYTLPITLTYEDGKAKMDMTAQFNDAFGKGVEGYLMQNPGSTMEEAQGAIMQQFVQLGINPVEGFAAEFNLKNEMKLPQSIGFGMSINATNSLRFALDAEWLEWSSAFQKMTITLTEGTNENINLMLGNGGNTTIEFPLEWENSLIIKIGGEYDVIDDLTLRTGYAYGSNPVPESTVFPVFPAIVENHIMVGGSYKITKPLAIHAAYEIALNNEETCNGTSLVANEYNTSTCQLGTNLFHISLSWNF
jgi:long-chain fatty acid transport protein